MSLTKVTRRQALAAAGAVAAGAAVTAAMPRMPPVKRRRNRLAKARRMIRFTPASHPKFKQRLERHFPGLSLQAEFGQLAPLAVLVTNAKGPALKALSLTWRLETADGPHESTLFFYHRATSRYPMSAQRHLARRRQTILVTPFFNVSRQRFRNGRQPDWSKAREKGEAPAVLLDQMGRARKVRVRVDAAVYSDWRLIGPDHGGLGRHLEIRRNAEHDEAVAMLRLLRDDASWEQITAALKQHRTPEGLTPLAVPPGSDHAWYLRARTLQAKLLLRDPQRKQHGALVHTLVALRKHRRTEIRPIG